MQENVEFEVLVRCYGDLEFKKMWNWGKFLIEFDFSVAVQTLVTVKSEVDSDVSDKGVCSLFISIICYCYDFVFRVKKM